MRIWVVLTVVVVLIMLQMIGDSQVSYPLGLRQMLRVPVPKLVYHSRSRDFVAQLQLISTSCTLPMKLATPTYHETGYVKVGVVLWVVVRGKSVRTE